MKYETIGGHVTEGETFRKAMHHLDELEECMYVLSHLRGLNGDKLTSQGFRAIGELFKLTRHNIVQIAKRGLQ